MKAIVSLSKKKGGKSKNPRSVFLSALMKALGGDTGDSVAHAFTGGDPKKFKDAMEKVVEKVAGNMPKSKSSD